MKVFPLIALAALLLLGADNGVTAADNSLRSSVAEKVETQALLHINSVPATRPTPAVWASIKDPCVSGCLEDCFYGKLSTCGKTCYAENGFQFGQGDGTCTQCSPGYGGEKIETCDACTCDGMAKFQECIQKCE